MPVTLYSGLPGSGKTAQLVAHIMRMLEKEPGRPMYALGINGLVDGLVEELTVEQLHKWWELPTGSAVFIDEAQESHLMPMTRNDPPEWIRRMSKVRHYAIDFYLTTQRPNYLSTYVRGLVDQHIHFVRKFNTHVVQSFTWGGCVDNPRSRVEQKASIQAVAALPRKVFSLYKSANVHNMKRRIPRQVYLLGGAALVAVAALICIPKFLHHAQDVATKGVTGGAPASSASQASAARIDADDALRTSDYAKWMRPRVAGLPWTAPAFDHATVKAEPKLYCIAADDGRCRCYTEQGTRTEVEANTCRAIVQNGVYNPFQEPQEQRDVAKRDRSADDDARSAPGARGQHAADADAVSGSSYKDRSTARLYLPPELVPHEAFSSVGKSFGKGQ